jgi:phenylpyruvate tautomerase PptA (4-oxalocrotonate tautomerase family)
VLSAVTTRIRVTARPALGAHGPEFSHVADTSPPARRYMLVGVNTAAADGPSSTRSIGPAARTALSNQRGGSSRHNRKDHLMPMIDVYATAGTFTDKHRLAADLAATLMGIEGVPDIPMFRQNTAAFVHELPAGDLSNVDGASDYVRVQVLTNAGALDRDKQIAVVSQFTNMVADAADDPALADRTWVLLTEAVPGGWGLGGHANTNDELVAAARKQIAELQAKAGGPAS